MKKLRILQIVDTLSAGGAERVAVNIADCLVDMGHYSALCTTREDGILSEIVYKNVERLSLKRKSTIDLFAFRKLINFNYDNQIEIIHAHSTSLFIGALAASFPPFPKLVWHDHYGLSNTNERNLISHRIAALRLDAVICVNEILTDWVKNKMQVAPNRVMYIPNFVIENKNSKSVDSLPGKTGKRILCVANIRRQKDHITLVDAMKEVVEHVPDAHLLLVGEPSLIDYFQEIQDRIILHGLSQSISMLGQRMDVSDIIQTCDIGVLSSQSEGLPLCLLEYGMAGLPVVTSNVGQCTEVVDGGNAGILVQPKNSSELARAIILLLSDRDKREKLGSNLKKRVLERYSQDAVMGQIEEIYKSILNSEKNIGTKGEIME